MSESKVYLTVNELDDHPNGRFIGVITRGHPQFGDQNVTVLTVERFHSAEAAGPWYETQLREKPWEVRQ